MTHDFAPLPPLCRSLLSVPAINARALEKTGTLDCDGVILDLEDSVATDKKAEARENLRRFLTAERKRQHFVLIRINALSSAFIEEDMALVRQLQPHGVLIPKVEDADDLRKASGWLSDMPPSLGLWAMMETAKGVLNAGMIAAARQNAAPRLCGFVVGLNDLRKETRVLPRPGRGFLVSWLMQVVLAARAHGLCVVDSVFNDFRALDAFEEECIQGREMGFDGKMLIHPNQIVATNRQFGPSETEIAEAKAIVAAFTKPASAQLNVINLDGRMIERLHLEEAEKLLALLHLIEQRKTSA